jgi:hypothetical protein
MALMEAALGQFQASVGPGGYQRIVGNEDHGSPIGSG